MLRLAHHALLANSKMVPVNEDARPVQEASTLTMLDLFHVPNVLQVILPPNQEQQAVWFVLLVITHKVELNADHVTKVNTIQTLEEETVSNALLEPSPTISDQHHALNAQLVPSQRLDHPSALHVTLVPTVQKLADLPVSHVLLDTSNQPLVQLAAKHALQVLNPQMVEPTVLCVPQVDSIQLLDLHASNANQVPSNLVQVSCRANNAPSDTPQAETLVLLNAHFVVSTPLPKFLEHLPVDHVKKVPIPLLKEQEFVKNALLVTMFVLVAVPEDVNLVALVTSTLLLVLTLVKLALQVPTHHSKDLQNVPNVLLEQQVLTLVELPSHNVLSVQLVNTQQKELHHAEPAQWAPCPTQQMVVVSHANGAHQDSSAIKSILTLVF